TSLSHSISLRELSLMSNQSFYITESAQHAYLTAQRLIFAFSASFILLVLFCLLRETPPHQASIKNHLIVIQITLCAKDVFMDVLFEPIILLPVPAGYCCGLLCRGTMHIQYQFIILMALYVIIGISILLCCLFRHQHLLPEQHWMKMGKLLNLAGAFGISLFLHMFKLLHT
ncbi:hypothetical protein PFISCL1PPCAC_16082, partial [Pristionchus fissidentatus]